MIRDQEGGGCGYGGEFGCDGQCERGEGKEEEMDTTMKSKIMVSEIEITGRTSDVEI